MADEAASRDEPLPLASASPVPMPARKPRGRPPGSKNKPKPPVVVTRESEAAMRPAVLELAAGCDVAGAVAAFARHRRVGVSVLCGRGAVAAVTLRLPTSPATASTVTLHGRFEILSLSGTVLPSAASEAAAPPPFAVSLAGAGGQVIGGTLAGEMTAAEGVVVVAATFVNAEVYRLPAAEAEDEEGEGGGGRDEGKHQPQHQPPPSQQQPQQHVVVVTSAGDVGLVGYGGGAVGLGGGGSGGQVGHHLQQHDMVLWAQPPASGGTAHHPTHY